MTYVNTTSLLHPSRDRSVLSRYSTAQDAVYEHVKQRILSGDLPGGRRLQPVEIAAELGVSRTPVREALHRLDIEGLVTLTPNRAVIVTSLTVDDVRELFKIRASLEMLAASEAAPRLQEDALDEFELLLRRMDRVKGDPKEWVARHEAFHDRLYEFAQMPRLSAEIRRMREAIHPYLRLYIDIYHHTEMPGYEHQTVLSEIASRDPQRAASAMRHHIDCAAAGVLDFLASRQRKVPELESAQETAPGEASAVRDLTHGSHASPRTIRSTKK